MEVVLQNQNRREKQKASSTPDMRRLARTVGNQAILQMMLTRSQARRIREGRDPDPFMAMISDYLSPERTFSRRELYPFAFAPIPEHYIYYCPKCQTQHDTSDISTDCDHITPLAKLFNKEWPESLRMARRREQFFREDNLQYMCSSQNRSKGSGGVEYNQRCAAACMIFKALNENPIYKSILTDYGDEMASADDVLDFLRIHRPARG